MDRIGRLIYTTDFDYKVYATAMRDISSTRVSLVLYIENPQGKMSDIITISKKDIYTKKTVFDFFFDMEGNFARDDISKIAVEILEVIKDEKNMTATQEKATMSELHGTVCDYIRNNAEDLEDNEDAEVFIKDNYGYMLTKKMDEFVKDNKELGYKRLEVLKRLKIMGALRTGSNRPYDILVSVSGVKKHFYKVIMISSETENMEEVIEI